MKPVLSPLSPLKKHLRALGALALFLAACTGSAPPVFFSGPILEGSGSSGELVLDGAVVNAQGQAAQDVQVTFTLSNARGEPIETLTAFVEGTDAQGELGPGEEGYFQASSQMSADQVAHIDYVISFGDQAIGPDNLR